MKCGKGHEHQTVAEVKACYGVTPAAPAQPGRVLLRDQNDRTRYASEKQIRYLTSLLSERAIPAELTEVAELLWKQAEAHDLNARDATDGSPMSAAAASQGIDVLAKLPRRAVDHARVTTTGLAKYNLPAGYYATPSATGNNDLDFWKVDRPTEGKWQGYTFIKRVIGGHPNAPVKGKTAEAAAKLIAEDPTRAGKAFADAIGSCYKCNRHLTDETSRQVGMGPECRSK